MTKREMFADIRNAVAGNEEMVAFIDHEIELLDRKKSGSRKPTKVQLENAQFKADILETMVAHDAPMTIKELFKECEPIAELSHQRVTHLLAALVNEGKVDRSIIKRVRYYAIASNDLVTE